MPDQLIRKSGAVGNRWLRIELTKGEDPTLVILPPGPVLIPAPLWLARRDELLARGGDIAVSLGPTFDPAEIAGDLGRFALIAVEFPKFTDGRGYSTARLLRERHGYKGELRAVGDVGRDQIFLLQRVGFDSFLIPEERNIDEALAAFTDFPEVYQTGTDQPLPLFRRRAA